MIGERIKELRGRLGLSKKDFAAKMGMNDRSVYKWENNKVEIHELSLRQIESTFKVNPEWLRHGKGNMFLLESTTDITPEAEKIFEWIKSLSPQEQAWADIEIQNKVEQYRKWRKNK